MLKNKRYFFEVVALTLFFTLFLYGCKKVTVPSVTGMTQAEALQELTSARLKVGDVTEAASSTVAVGDIISQDPTAGSSAIRGSTVDLVVSNGPVLDTIQSIYDTLASIPSGTFEMGCSPGDTTCDEAESPRHTVTISNGFKMSAYEITQGQWQAVMGTNPSILQLLRQRLPGGAGVME